MKYTPSHWVTRSICFHEGGTTVNLSQSYLHSPITCHGTVALDLSLFLFLTPGKRIHGKEPWPWLSLWINVFCCWEHQYPWGKHYLLEFVMRYSTGMDDLLCIPGWGRASLSLLGLHCPAAAELVQTHCNFNGSHTIEIVGKVRVFIRHNLLPVHLHLRSAFMHYQLKFLKLPTPLS